MKSRKTRREEAKPEKNSEEKPSTASSESSPKPGAPNEEGVHLRLRKFHPALDADLCTFYHWDLPLDPVKILDMSKDRLVLSCTGQSYRTVRLNRGVKDGTWFCEFQILPESSSYCEVRVGFANDVVYTTAPLGSDTNGYAIRNRNLERIHQGIRYSFGRSSTSSQDPPSIARDMCPGDVVGILIDFNTPADVIAEAIEMDQGASVGPRDGERLYRAIQTCVSRAPAVTRSDLEAMMLQPEPARYPQWHGSQERKQISGVPQTPILKWKPGDFQPVNSRQTVALRHWGSSIRFYLNGKDLGPAFTHLTREPMYFPAITVFNGGVVKANPGPNFRFPPPQPYAAGAAPWRPFSDLAANHAAKPASAGGLTLRIAPSFVGNATAAYAFELGLITEEEMSKVRSRKARGITQRNWIHGKLITDDKKKEQEKAATEKKKVAPPPTITIEKEKEPEKEKERDQKKRSRKE
jgi:SPRY domain